MAMQSTSEKEAILIKARQLQMYLPNEKVLILRGDFAGKILTVRFCTEHEVHLMEFPKREVMSKLNVEPEAGFSKEALALAAAESRRGE